MAGEAEKLAKRLHPRDDEAAERHAVDAFLGALDRPLAAEVQKLGCRTMEEVVAAARRIERILEERTTSGMEQIIQSMQSQIQILTKDMAKAHEQMASQAPATTPTTSDVNGFFPVEKKPFFPEKNHQDKKPVFFLFLV